MKNDKKKRRSKTRFRDPIKKCAKLTDDLITDAYRSNVIRFKLDKDTLQHCVYLLSFMNSLKNLFSRFSGTYMLLIYYPSIRG